MPDAEATTSATTLLEALSADGDAVVVLDDTGVCVGGNRAGARLLGDGEHPPGPAGARPRGRLGDACARVVERRRAEDVDLLLDGVPAIARVLPAPSGVVVLARARTPGRPGSPGSSGSPGPSAVAGGRPELAAHLEQVVEHADAGLVLKDLEGTYLLANTAFARLVGRDRAAILGRTAEDVLPPASAAIVRARDQAVAASRSPRQNEEVLELRPGSAATYLAVRFPTFDADGALSGTGSLYSDVTAFRHTQALLEASERRLRDLFRGASLGQVIVRASGETVEANDAFCAMLGYGPAEVATMHLSSLVSAPPTWQERVGRMCSWGAEGYEIETHLLRRDGSECPVLVTVGLLDTPPGESQLISWVVQDLSQVRALQARVFEAERMEAVGVLARGVAHDFNNVLAAVSGYADLALAEAGEQPGLERHLLGIHRAVDRAGGLVGRLLAFARQQELELAEVDLGELVGGLEDMLRRLLPDTATLTVETTPGTRVEADPVQLQQVLLNLVVNAREALDGAGRIELVVDALELGPGATSLTPGHYARLRVRDDGHGMAPEVRRHCFEPFFTTRSGSGGNGLGLSTAFGIARQSGGDLRVESEPGTGTTFSLLLPLLPRGPDAPGAAPRGPDRPILTLLAEDDPEMRALLAEVLAGAGHEVLAAADGQAALSLADERTVDLLVTDLVMPHLGGRELLERLRGRWPDLPAVVVSSERAGPLEGPTVSLRKPFAVAAFVAAVGQLLERRRA